MKQNIILLLLFVWVLSACSDFLEPKSQTEYIARDVNSLNELLIGSAYIDPRYSMVATFCYNDLFSDDWACSPVIFQHTDNEKWYTNMKPLFAWHPDMFTISRENNNYWNIWSSFYTNILGCNAALDHIDKVSGTAEAKAHVAGQALGLRAFYYFQLVNLFGEPYHHNKTAPGVPLKLDSKLSLEYPERATVEEVFLQIVADLDEAEKAFLKAGQDKQFIKDGTVGLPMVQLMRARTALFMSDHATAITYANKVINDWDFSLFNLNSFTSTSAAPYYEFCSYNNPEAIWLFGSSPDFARFASLTNHVNPNNYNDPRRMFNASNSLLDSYAADDLRKDNYIYKEGLEDNNNYQPFGKGLVSVSTATTGLRKTIYSPVTGTPNSWGRALRLAEAYLILAEAAHLNKDDATAVSILETLRQSRFTTASGDAYKVPVESASGDALFNFIKAERRRETCFEGLRWFDQRRWGMESFSREWKENGEEITLFTMEKNDPAFTLPIPFDVIEKNPRLVQNKLSTPKY